MSGDDLFPIHPEVTGTGLEGKAAIVTGAGRGLGATIARKLAAAGARVVLGDLDVEACEVNAAELGDAVGCRLDVTDASQWLDAVELCRERFGGPHVLVNNAGLGLLQPFEETSEETFDATMAVNVKGVFLGMQAVFEPMKAQGGGSIVNISSSNGYVASPEAGVYVASKFAVRGLTRNGAYEWADHGIRVNAVCPGMIRTSMVPEHEMAYIPKLTPLGRIAEPHEIAEAVVFLASDRSSYITGSDIVADGGIISGVQTHD